MSILIWFPAAVHPGCHIWFSCCCSPVNAMCALGEPQMVWWPNPGRTPGGTRSEASCCCHWSPGGSQPPFGTVDVVAVLIVAAVVFWTLYLSCRCYCGWWLCDYYVTCSYQRYSTSMHFGADFGLEPAHNLMLVGVFVCSCCYSSINWFIPLLLALFVMLLTAIRMHRYIGPLHAISQDLVTLG